MDLWEERRRIDSSLGEIGCGHSPSGQDQRAGVYGKTESDHSKRRIDDILNILYQRYGGAHPGKACTWMGEFANFCREAGAAHGGSWARFARATTRLEDSNLKLSDLAVCNKAIQPINQPDAQLSEALSALETKAAPTSATPLNAITIRMYETHKSTHDITEVYDEKTGEPDESHNWPGNESPDQTTMTCEEQCELGEEEVDRDQYQ